MVKLNLLVVFDRLHITLTNQNKIQTLKNIRIPEDKKLG